MIGPLPLTLETGFWRPVDNEHLEVVLSHPEGWVEIWAGRIPKPGQIAMETDVVARTTSAEVEYTGGARLYGNVDRHLMWSFDRATTTEKRSSSSADPSRRTAPGSMRSNRDASA